MAHQRLLEHRHVAPAARRYSRPLLLVHGAWHGAWCWEQAMQDFARRGFAIHALSLRGHGESGRPGMVNLCGVADYLRDIEAALDRIEPAPIVIGHSMGGFLVQRLLARRQLPGAVLLCTAPHTGALPFLLKWSRDHPLAALRTFTTLNTRHLVGTPALAREAFFRPDLPEAESAAVAARLVPESVRMAVEMSIPRRVQPVATPLLVVAAERDMVFTLDEQRATAAAYGAELVIIPGATHDLMLDPAWPQAADQIERAVGSWLA